MSAQPPLYFYRQHEKPYGVFSNFYLAPITLNSLTWPTTEHYFQAQKFPTRPDLQLQIQQAESPGKAARLGRNKSFPLRSDWERIKDSVMKECLIAKFTQYPEFRDLLLGTEDRILVEHTANDRYWADGGDGTGKNMLGILLMEIRNEFRAADSAERHTSR
ncbi:hypothetical protein HK097_007207 [Rhizophlyctis rosea]|uniref:NADAR domain-containing protein n=1 Tax=Rhizophlyctis rosea TaxID=64517 RepID=A0AAD5X5V9_9FUNG|nr:hypothetical protein HK097_007207 [Rhizophlyctis rosea]